MKATWSAVEQSARDISEADADALSSALDDLEAAVDDLPGGQTVAQAKAQLEPQLTARAP